MPHFTIGFSPCPNDTFIFDALVNQKIDTGDFRFDYCLEDVETLNQWALEGRLPVTKVSYSTFLKVADRYALCHSGSALGSGVGPLLVSKSPAPPDTDIAEAVNRARIAIPGKNTTANLLFTLAFPQATSKTEVLFSEIEAGVLSGDFDLGLIIHENRFTYFERGLHRWMDMGEWWEKETGSAIPLGGICIDRNIPAATARAIDRLIQQSIAYSWQHYPELSPFVKEHAQEMEEKVMRQHIELYVNEYTSALGSTGTQAVDRLFEMARSARLITQRPASFLV